MAGVKETAKDSGCVMHHSLIEQKDERTSRAYKSSLHFLRIFLGVVNLNLCYNIIKLGNKKGKILKQVFDWLKEKETTQLVFLKYMHHVKTSIKNPHGVTNGLSSRRHCIVFS